MKRRLSYRLVLFDMDGTLLNGRSIFYFAEEFGFKQKLISIFNSTIEPYKKSIEIAQYLRGTDSRSMLEIFQKIPLQKGIQKILTILNNKKIITAIATDSYSFLADKLRERLKMHAAFANTLIIKNHIVTGDVILHNSKLERCNNGRIYSICKGQILRQLCKENHVSLEQSIAIGDGFVDISMLQKAGLGIAYKAREEVQQHADLCTDDISLLLQYL